MDAPLHAQLDEVIEALRDEVHQQAECWSTIRTPSALFDFEQGLQAVLNKSHTGIVGAVLEAIHRDRNFVTACQNQSRLQGGVYSDGWRDVWVLTLGGQHVHLRPRMQNSQRRVGRNTYENSDTNTAQGSTLFCVG